MLVLPFGRDRLDSIRETRTSTIQNMAKAVYFAESRLFNFDEQCFIENKLKRIGQGCEECDLTLRQLDLLVSLFERIVSE